MRYELKERVRYSEVDEDACLSLISLMNLFQDVSVFHSEEVGYGVAELKTKGMAWLISSWQIELPAPMPRLGEAVTAVTWAYAFEAFYGLRNHQLLDAEGNCLAAANSYWVLFDTRAQKPVRVSDEMAGRFCPEPRQEMLYQPRKIALPGKGIPVTEEASFIIGKDSIDTNHHVNNGQYIRFAEEYMPEDMNITGVRVEYKQQARLGDRITPRIYMEDGRMTVALCGDSGRPYAVVVFSGNQIR